MLGECACRLECLAGRRAGHGRLAVDDFQRVVDARKAHADRAAAESLEGRLGRGVGVVPPFDAIRRAADGDEELAGARIALRDEAVKCRRRALQDEVLHKDPRHEAVARRKIRRRRLRRRQCGRLAKISANTSCRRPARIGRTAIRVGRIERPGGGGRRNDRGGFWRRRFGPRALGRDGRRRGERRKRGLGQKSLHQLVFAGAQRVIIGAVARYDDSRHRRVAAGASLIDRSMSTEKRNT